MTNGPANRLSLGRCANGMRRSLATFFAATLWLMSGGAQGARLADGINYLIVNQSADGAWRSASVRPVHATAEAARALRLLGAGLTARQAAADFLALAVPSDTDDRARRIRALLGEGRDVNAHVTRLLADADAAGGWGLFPEFRPDPIDTALALPALNEAGVSDPAIRLALSYLVAAQNPDGGWGCVRGGSSDVSCSADALAALAAYREQFVLDTSITRARTFLLGQVNTDGSIGMGVADPVYVTALAVRALVAIGDNLGAARPNVISFIDSQQLLNGSWSSDPLVTAVALQAADALARVPICGDGVVNGAFEFCDGADVRGQSCESLGFGPGILSCTAGCTFDTSACTAAPVCGDGVRNRPEEFCDGSDLGGLSCAALGFTAGTLACGSACTFDTSACTGTAAFCGDGSVNRPVEQCDRADFAGQTCTTLGLGFGTLGCTNSCQLDTSGCSTAAGVSHELITFGAGSAVCAGQTETIPISITLPSQSTANRVDVFLLFDDTGSFAGLVPPVRSIFQSLVNDLQVALPGVSFGFGVGRFEDYGGSGTGFSGEFTTGRPFILNQPIITPDTPNFLTLINAALARTAPGFGGDGPETALEALYQVATGAGFDGNGDGSLLNSGPAGAASTQTNPGASGDVPPFSSNVAAAAGSIGGAGFREGALRLVILATDICSVAAYDRATGVPTTITSAGGAVVPSGALHCSASPGSNRFGFVSNSKTTSGNTVPGAVAPAGAARVPQIIQALNERGISVIGLAPGGVPVQNPVNPSIAPSTLLSALAILTGATDLNGRPLVFNISGGAGPLRTAVVNAVTTAATRPLNVRVRAVNVPAGVTVTFAPDVVTGVAPGGRADFNMSVTGTAGVKGGFDVEFFDQATNSILGRIPVQFSCGIVIAPPVDADRDGFPEGQDCNDADPTVNPAATEILGNGKDDDCNPATPDVVALTELVCSVSTDKISYGAQETMRVDLALTRVATTGSLSSLTLELFVDTATGNRLGAVSESLAPLAPAERRERSFSFPTGSEPPGDVTITARVLAGNAEVARCAAGARIVSSLEQGLKLTGTITADPGVVNADNIAQAFLRYEVTNPGNAAWQPAAIEILIVRPTTGEILTTLTDSAPLPVGASYANAKPTPRGLSQGDYLVILRGGRENQTETLASTTLTIVNSPPSCVQARASVDQLWPPNHQMVRVGIAGVVDPDGDPVTVEIFGVTQDEPVVGAGSGNTCPDAIVTGDGVELRAERSGQGDGRVYRIHFGAKDPVEAQCSGVVTACVPHDQSGRGCVDSPAVHNATICPTLRR